MKYNQLLMLQCPVCKNELNSYKKNSFKCAGCNKIYAEKGGIPIILKNAKKSISFIKNKIKKNPTWYTDYQITYNDIGSYRHHTKKRVDYLDSVFKKYNLLKSMRILDAGCGDGINLRFLINIPDSIITGIDYNFIRMRRAKKNIGNKMNFVVSDLLEHGFKDSSFDMIFCSHVLEHITEDLEALKNFYRMLKPGGFLILGVPNEGALLWKLHYKYIQPKILKQTDHKNFYTDKAMLKKLQKAKFNILETKHIGWGVPHTGIDEALRQYKFIDDLFEKIGNKIFKKQSTSLYFICKKP